MQVLLLSEHGHHDECVQVDALTQHPEVVTAQHVHVKEVQHLAPHLMGGGGGGREGEREREREVTLDLTVYKNTDCGIGDGRSSGEGV